MVNLGLNWSSLLGIIVAVAGAGLYFLRSWKPKLARDHDIFFAAVGLLCGGILLFQGWRLDPILAFGQFLLTGTAIFFAVESINLRGVATQQAKSRPSMVEDDRPVSPVYSYVDAELEELEPVEEYPPNRRLRGDRDYRSSRPDAYEEDYRQRPSSRSSRSRPTPPEATRQRRPRSQGRPPTGEDWDVGGSDEPTTRSRPRPNNWETPPEEPPKPSRSRPPRDWDLDAELEDPASRGGRPSRTSVTDDPMERTTRPRRRPPESFTTGASSRPEVPPRDDYVEYRPVEDPNELENPKRPVDVNDDWENPGRFDQELG